MKIFSIQAGDLSKRLDASHHIPEVRAVKESLAGTGLTERTLGEVADIAIPARFKRVYTNAQHGTPFLQGSHVPMIRPTEVRYLSNVAHMKENATHHVKKEQILVTCSGTLGRVTLATKVIDGWAASQHIARVSAGSDLQPCFLYALLTSIYGQYQLQAQTYGAVIDELTEAQIGALRVVVPPMNIQRAIGNRVVKAFELRDQANVVEDNAIARLERLLGTDSV